MPDMYEGLIKIRDSIHTPEENDVLEREFKKFLPLKIEIIYIHFDYRFLSSPKFF